ncbi:3-phosphoshikimate 1-carboxyvinyltransferase [Holophaga foetida]|uniref:3-phosphoshikimate 1-carboxyvinyltransferase n=1 Tax=Holophaga foetida TaxID=35839 RepID=UPI0002473EC1|nr:3-phosphoshikimate 1-carboxyvinyltransferase [Holophaga foetida]
MIQIAPGPVSGRLRAPASKSHAQRVLIAASLAEGTSRILNPGSSADVRACLSVIQALGAQVEDRGQELLIRGGGQPASDLLDCGESGFCLRSTSAVAALFDRRLTLAGHGSLATRPVDMVVDALRQFGVLVETRGGCPPVTIQGPLRGGRAVVDGSSSSQFLSGLLLALPRAQGDSELEVQNLRSGPYVQMTLDVLKAFGLQAEATADLSRFRIPGRQAYRAATVDVEGDWSGAAFLLVAGAIAGDVTVEGLLAHSAQADRAILAALEAAGAVPVWEQGAVRVRRTDLRAFDFDATDCPDLFPPLAALACHCEGTTRILGVDRLKHKESDRAAALCKELGALGAAVEVQGNLMLVTGGPLRGATVDSHNDHRIAMAAAVAALRSQFGVAIEGEGCVAKSYPEFFEDLATLQGHS